MADYTDQITWYDETGVGDGTVIRAAHMNAIEAALNDASAHHGAGPVSARPAATALTKNWLWFAEEGHVDLCVESAPGVFEWATVLIGGGSTSTVGPRGPKGDAGTDGAPVGAVITWTGSTIPPDYALANGQTLNQADYPEAYDYAAAEVAAGNSLWNVNATAGTFTVPDLTDRFIFSKGAKPLGQKAGAETVLLTARQSGLRDHIHSVLQRVASTGDKGGAVPYVNVNAPNFDGYNAPTNGTGNQAALDAHNNMPPYVVLALLVKVVAPSSGTPGVITVDATSASTVDITGLVDGLTYDFELDGQVAQGGVGCWISLFPNGTGGVNPGNLMRGTLTREWTDLAGAVQQAYSIRTDERGLVLGAIPFTSDQRILAGARVQSKTGLARLARTWMVTGAQATNVNESSFHESVIRWDDVSTVLTHVTADFGGGTFTGRIIATPTALA